MNFGQVALVGLSGVVLGALLYRFRKDRPDVYGDDASPMPPSSRRWLVAYLLLTGASLAVALVLLFSIDIPDATVLPETPDVPPTAARTGPAQEQPAQPAQGATNPTGQGGPQVQGGAGSNDTTPVVRGVFHHIRPGNPSTVSLVIYGDNFTDSSRVRLNGSEQARKYVGPQLLDVTPSAAALTGVGAITVDVVNGDRRSNAMSVTLDRPRAYLLPGRLPISREVQLLLIVIFAGALGSYVHALQSLSDFIGNRTLTASWFWWYISRPFLGMAMALIFYAVLRGGFLAGTPADAKVVNAFAVMAVAALVGMFTDKATQKLAEVFDTLFKSADVRGGKLSALVIDRLEPDTVMVGTPKPVVLAVVGERLGRVTAVRLDKDERKPDTVSDKKVTITLQPQDIASMACRNVAVVNDEGAVSPAVSLHISDLAISNDRLPDAPVNVQYKEQLKASGGTPPYTWSVSGVTWLTIDANESLIGTPTKTGAFKVTLKVVDQQGASATTTCNLKVA